MGFHSLFPCFFCSKCSGPLPTQRSPNFSRSISHPLSSRCFCTNFSVLYPLCSRSLSPRCFDTIYRQTFTHMALAYCLDIVSAQNAAIYFLRLSHTVYTFFCPSLALAHFYKIVTTKNAILSHPLGSRPLFPCCLCRKYSSMLSARLLPTVSKLFMQ